MPPRSPIAGGPDYPEKCWLTWSPSWGRVGKQGSEIPKSRATCATKASSLRATAMTSRRNFAGNGLGTMLLASSEDEA